MLTKGYMQKKLREAGIRKINGKKFNEVKTHEIITTYYNAFGGFTK